MRLADIIRILEDIAPPKYAVPDDPIGLQIGDPGSEVRSIVVTTSVTPAVASEVIRRSADLLVTHHAVIYAPLRSVRLDIWPQSLVYHLVNAGIGLYVMHTNYDAAPGGINDVLCERLGIVDTSVLEPTYTGKMFKLTTFVPSEAVDTVREAMAAKGAGIIGNYSHCSFQTPGSGTFKPMPGAEPYIGHIGELEKAPEFRLEMLVPESRLHDAITAMIAAHPYEEVAYDVYPLWNKGEEAGIGRRGRLQNPTTLAGLCAAVQEALGVREIRVYGSSESPVETVAVLGGGGGSRVGLVASMGVDAYITGDVMHHQAVEAEARGLSVIDATHFWTERPGMIALAPRLHDLLSSQNVTVEYFDDFVQPAV